MALNHLGDLQLSVNKEWDIVNGDGTTSKKMLQAGKNLPINSVTEYEDCGLVDVTTTRGFTIVGIDKGTDASILGRPDVTVKATRPKIEAGDKEPEAPTSFDFDFKDSEKDV